MLKIEIIGNLGADAEQKMANGKSYLSFRVAETRKFADKVTGEMVTSTTWVSCSMDGEHANLLQYLKKGQRVFIRGNMEIRLYVSSKDGQRHAGISVYVKELELCGSNRSDLQIKSDQGADEQEANSEELKPNTPF